MQTPGTSSSGQEKAETKETNINEIVDAALTIVDHQLSINDVKITRELDPNMPQIQASANQLQQVIMNFAINAQQAMGENGGNLTVSASTLTVDIDTTGATPTIAVGATGVTVGFADVTLTDDTSVAGSVQWICASGGVIEDKHLPSACR